MSGPGKGRYTTFVTKASSRNSLLWKLFNKRAPNDRGVFFGSQEPSDNAKAAEAALARATAEVKDGVGGLNPEKGRQAGDPGMFPTGVDLAYGGTDSISPPDTSKVEWKNPGDPANGFIPDISSPGPEKTNPLDKDQNPSVSPGDIKPNYIPGAPGTGTTAPSSTSSSISRSLNKNLEKGKSSV